MARTEEERKTANAAASKKRYEARKDAISLRRAELREANGHHIRPSTKEKYAKANVPIVSPEPSSLPIPSFLTPASAPSAPMAAPVPKARVPAKPKVQETKPSREVVRMSEVLEAINARPTAASTRKMQTARIVSVMKAFGCKGADDNVAKCLQKMPAFLEFIKKTYPTLNTQRAYISAFVLAVDNLQKLKAAIGSKASTLLHEAYSGKVEDVKTAQEAAVNDETKSVMSFTAIKEAVDAKYKEGTMQNLVMHLYDVCCVRDDYGMVKIVKSEADARGPGNYLVLYARKAPLFILKEYKTAARYGTQMFTLTKEIGRLIHKSLKEQPREWLICKEDGQVYNKGDVSKEGTLSGFISGFCKSAGLEGVTIDTFRHATVSEELANMPEAERKTLSSVMLHAPATQLLYVRKLKEVPVVPVVPVVPSEPTEQERIEALRQAYVARKAAIAPYEKLSAPILRQMIKANKSLHYYTAQNIKSMMRDELIGVIAELLPMGFDPLLQA